MKRRQQKEVKRFTEYLISGGAYFWAGYGAFFVGDKVLHLNLWWAKLGANLFGWSVNYVLQRYWVFSNPGLKKHQTEVTTRYIIITLVDFLMDYLLIRGLKNLGLTPYLGQFVSAGFFTAWNYFWYRFWVFPEKLRRKPVKLGMSRGAIHRAHGHSAFHARA
jgi:putative flippase GtrA